MAEPFKQFINAPLVEAAARHLARANTSFDAAGFVRRVVPQLEALELKARAMCMADALEQYLPSHFAEAADTIERALAPVAADDASTLASDPTQGLAGWALWPVGEFVARRGLDEPVRALSCLREVTKRFTAEFAIRPFIARHPELLYSTLGTWARDPSAHVRRLVSEGSRPRLPWGMQLKASIANPHASWPLLEALMDDSSEYVRRSVANHLNDIAKDHPQLMTEWVARQLPGASPARTALLKHASRTLIKKGDRRMLELWGVGTAFAGVVTLTLSPEAMQLGSHVQLSLTVTSQSAATQRVAIDYVVHHVKANGSTSPKVFKGWVSEIPAGATMILNKRHAMKPITTRRYYPGVHRVDVQVNGHVMASATVHLSM